MDSAPSPASPAHQAKRRSCALCRRHKSKCIGGPPCRRCVEGGVACVPQPPPSRSLVDRVSVLENQNEGILQKLKRALREISELKGRPVGDGDDDEVDSDEAEDDTAEGESVSGRRTGVDATSNGKLVDKQYEGDEEDLTLIEGIRLGKIPAGSVLSGEGDRRGKKRPRTTELDLNGENTKAMENVALNIFYTRCAHKIPFINPRSEEDPQDLRVRSPLMYWAMIAVGSREAEELKPIHTYAEQTTFDRARMTLFGSQPAIDDLKGLMIISMWLSAARAPGHAVGMAHELGLGEKCEDVCRAFEAYRMDVGASSRQPFERAKEMASVMRIYAYLYMVDRVTASVTGRPHLIMERDTAKMAAMLLHLPDRRITDIRLAAQVEIAVLLDGVRAPFNGYLTPGNQDNIKMLPIYNQSLDHWFNKWSDLIMEPMKATPATRRPEDQNIAEQLMSSIRFLYSVSRLYINTFPLRGIKTASQITTEQMTCLRVSVSAGRAVCVQAVKRDSPINIIYTSNLTQLQLTFAAVFLLRMMRLLPGEFEEMIILEEIRALAELLSQISGQYFSQRIYQMLRHIEKLRDQNNLLRKAQPTIAAPWIDANGRGQLTQSIVNGSAAVAPRQQQAAHPLASTSPNDWNLDWDTELGTSAFWQWMQDENKNMQV